MAPAIRKRKGNTPQKRLATQQKTQFSRARRLPNSIIHMTIEENTMATSPLLGADRTDQRPRGTGIDVLGPSDSSDTGSDLMGGAGAVDAQDTELDTGTNSDPGRARGAGADVGDADFNADSDRSGTGERAAAGRDTALEASDISPDHIVQVEDEDEDEALDPEPARRQARSNA